MDENSQNAWGYDHSKLNEYYYVRSKKKTTDTKKPKVNNTSNPSRTKPRRGQLQVGSSRAHAHTQNLTSAGVWSALSADPPLTFGRTIHNFTPRPEF